MRTLLQSLTYTSFDLFPSRASSASTSSDSPAIAFERVAAWSRIAVYTVMTVLIVGLGFGYLAVMYGW